MSLRMKKALAILSILLALVLLVTIIARQDFAYLKTTYFLQSEYLAQQLTGLSDEQIKSQMKDVILPRGVRAFIMNSTGQVVWQSLPLGPNPENLPIVQSMISSQVKEEMFFLPSSLGFYAWIPQSRFVFFIEHSYYEIVYQALQRFIGICVCFIIVYIASQKLAYLKS